MLGDSIQKVFPASMGRTFRRLLPARKLDPLSHRSYDTYDKKLLTQPPDESDFCNDDLPDPPSLPPSYEIEASTKAHGLPKSLQIEILREVDAVMGRLTASLLTVVGDAGDILAVSSAIRYGCTEAATVIIKDDFPTSEDELDHSLWDARDRVTNSITAAANLVPLGKQIEVAMAAAGAIAEISHNTFLKVQQQQSMKGYTSAQSIVALGWASSAASCLTGQAHGTAGNIAQRILLILADWSRWSKKKCCCKTTFLTDSHSPRFHMRTYDQCQLA